MLDGFFNAIFGWSINIHPAFGIAVITFFITLLVTLAYKYFTDQHIMESVKAEIKKLQKEIKKNKDNPDKMMKIQKEMMSHNMKVFKMNLKPMIITLLPVLLLFSWLRAVEGLQGDVLWFLSWFWTYLIFTLVFSFALRKLLKVH